ncbi:MAG: ATP-binding protein [Oscillospiraceae bacterium]|nr:ATP-binding protein [Oscillospiraceae bacterium]
MKKKIFIGAESFERIREEDFFYVDKTLFIKELLDNRGAVTLITRPRRFGKTLNMSMLRSFFDITSDSKVYFEGLAITDYQEICEKYMNKYPVVSMTLKNVELDTYESTIARLKTLISTVFEQYLFVYESEILTERQKEMFHTYFMRRSSDEELQYALVFLTECLYVYYQKRVIILLDEYDAPIDNAERNGFYNDMISFMRGFLGSVFKTNDYLEFGVLTGVQRVSKEGLFSSFNNPKICGLLNEEFNSCFGFTEDEVKAACEMYEIDDKYQDIKKWYDGYRIGGRDMYNPWSITMYLERQKLENYWVNTGSVQVLRDVFHQGDNRLRDALAGLLTGSTIRMSITDHITYPIKYVSTNTFWTLLLHAGYLKPCNGAKDNIFEAELVNMEVKDTFSFFAKEWLSEERTLISEQIEKFVEYLLSGNAQGVSTILNDELLNNPSSYDFTGENSYHMFIYGMLLAASGNYTVHSNQETGRGRADCMIKPFDMSEAAVIVEFKHLRMEPVNLKEEAEKGLEQINNNAYSYNLRNEGYATIHKYGIAFYKKSCEVVME